MNWVRNTPSSDYTAGFGTLIAHELGHYASIVGHPLAPKDEQIMTAKGPDANWLTKKEIEMYEGRWAWPGKDGIGPSNFYK